MIKNKDPPRQNPFPRRKAFPSNMPRPCRMRGLQLVNSWSSRPGEPFAGLPKCVEDAGQKEVRFAGLRGPARAARASLVRFKRVFITNVNGTFFGMSESVEAAKRR
jgi:hypothetical protein